jgi:hypothetical protein
MRFIALLVLPKPNGSFISVGPCMVPDHSLTTYAAGPRLCAVRSQAVGLVR